MLAASLELFPDRGRPRRHGEWAWEPGRASGGQAAPLAGQPAQSPFGVAEQALGGCGPITGSKDQVAAQVGLSDPAGSLGCQPLS